MTNQRRDNTIKNIFCNLNEMFHFNFDAYPDNNDFNGLEVEWKERNYVNLINKKEIGQWVKKGYEESKKNRLVVMLISAATDSGYWHDYIMNSFEIWFIRGRLKDEKGKGITPFPSVIVVLDEQSKQKQMRRFPGEGFPRVMSVQFEE